MLDNGNLVRRSTVTTGDLGAERLLNPDQGRAFVEGVMKRAETLSKVRRELCSTPTKKINKILINERVARKASQNTAPRTQNPFSWDQVVLTPVPIDLAYELTKEVLRDNIEREAFEQKAATKTEEAFARDLNDLFWNGDDEDYSAAATTLGAELAAGAVSATAADTTDFPDASFGFGYLVIGDERIRYESKDATHFLSLTRGVDGTDDVVHANGVAVTFVPDALLPSHDGILKLVRADGSVVDPSALGDGGFSIGLMNEMVDQIPEKFLQVESFANSWRWFGNRKTKRAWGMYIAGRATAGGDAAIKGETENPLGYPWHLDAHIPDGTMVFGPLLGAIQGIRYDTVRYRKTSEGKDLVSRGATYYKWEWESIVALDEPTAFAIAEGITISNAT